MLKDHHLLPGRLELLPAVKIQFVQILRFAALTQVQEFPALVIPRLQIAERLISLNQFRPRLPIVGVKSGQTLPELFRSCEILAHESRDAAVEEQSRTVGGVRQSLLIPRQRLLVLSLLHQPVAVVESFFGDRFSRWRVLRFNLRARRYRCGERGGERQCYSQWSFHRVNLSIKARVVTVPLIWLCSFGEPTCLSCSCHDFQKTGSSRFHI